MKKLFSWVVALVALGAAIGLYVTRPEVADPAAVAAIEPDLERGQLAFAAAGCASCHAAPGATGEAKLVLAGGERFETDFGTFIAPNISSDPDVGIGAWTIEELVNAIMFGTSPGGKHYFPAFPYTSYARADPADVVSLAAYLKTLPADPTPSLPHEVGFPFNIRLSLGGWKYLYFNDDTITPISEDPLYMRGRALVEGLGHCGECHTPRNALGGPDLNAWLTGAPNPSGRGRIPAIKPPALEWAEEDIANYLETGFTPDFDSAGGTMVDVIENMAQLPPEDRAAIARYLVSLN